MAWHFVESGKTFGPLTDQQLSGLIASGRIGPETMVWRAGMAAWAPAGQTDLAARFGGSGNIEHDPVEDLLASGLDASALAPIEPVAAEGIPLGDFTDPRPATRRLRTALLAAMVIGSLAMLVFALFGGRAFQRTIQGYRLTTQLRGMMDDWMLAGGVIISLHLIAAAAAFYLWLMWLRVAQGNLLGLHPAGVQTTPVRALLVYFIPIVNLIQPPRDFQVLWRASLDPVVWQDEEVSGQVRLWGVLHMASWILLPTALMWVEVQEVRSLMIRLFLVAIMAGAHAAQAMVTFHLIDEVCESQLSHARKHGWRDAGGT